MGVQGLLPVLKSVTDQVHVSKYAGKTVGVDASGWLYKGAYSCPIDLVLGRPTDAYLNFSIQQLKLLKEHNITPILVFDGAPLPAKAQENAKRAGSRTNWKQKALEMLQQEQQDRDSRALFSACCRAVAVTNEMVMKLIAALRRMNVTFYVAPYEADAQLAFLSRQKIVDVVISDDSDCVPYGVKAVMFKFSQDGWGSELKRRSLGANEELSFVGWTEEMFIQLCVLAGCDYCPSIAGVGVITAYKLVSQHKTPVKVVSALQGQKAVPDNYEEQFYSAILTYRHQLVFDPRDEKLKMLSPLDISKEILPLVDQGLHFLGNVELRDEVVASIASGQIHPRTHESYVWKDTAAAVLQEEQQAGLGAKTSGLLSMTSSESSDLMMPHQPAGCRSAFQIANSSKNLPEEDEDTSSTEQGREYDPSIGRPRSAASHIQYEKPRPSSRSSWTHLDSVLGSSDHIVNFRSPKVSENFKPLAALHDPVASVSSSSISAQDLREFESRPVRSHLKRVRNPTHRRREGKGSGFEGEVVCTVDASSMSDRQGSNMPVNDVIDSATNVENAPPSQAKRPKLFVCPSSPRPSSSSSRMSVETRQNPPVRPTPFGCGQSLQTVASSPPCSVGFNWTLPPRGPQQYQRSIQPATQTSCLSRATSAEEKWDRILGDEIDEGSDSNSNSQVGGDKDIDVSPRSVNASSSSRRQPLAPINNSRRDLS